MSKIIKLTSENVKRLSVVEISPAGNMVVIGGKNGQGKSSVLDSIEYALGGDTADRMPVRVGEEKARIVLDLGDIIVRRTFTAAGGSSLVVTNADGVKQASPQAMLDKLTGKLTFDPLEFARQNPKQQAETLRALVGLDVSKLDAEKETVFANRTNVNREAKALEARMTSMPKHDGLPDAETSTAEIMAQQQAAAQVNASNQKLRNDAITAEMNEAAARRTGEVISAQIKTAKDEITRLLTSLAMLEESLVKEREAWKLDAAEAKAARAKADSVADIDLTPFKDQCANAEVTNAKIRANAARAEIVKSYKAKSAEAEKLTKRIDEIEAEKRRTVTSAKYPIEGLSFDAAGGVTLGGIPFSQCSSAEQLRVSVAIGLALNPTLRVLLIRDGSLLDEDSMKMIADMATKSDAQIWLEVVSTDKAGCSVVLEDGHIKE